VPILVAHLAVFVVPCPRYDLPRHIVGSGFRDETAAGVGDGHGVDRREHRPTPGSGRIEYQFSPIAPVAVDEWIGHAVTPLAPDESVPKDQRHDMTHADPARCVGHADYGVVFEVLNRE
jgi:hypothetical protein